jgi:hypothetical protein
MQSESSALSVPPDTTISISRDRPIRRAVGVSIAISLFAAIVLVWTIGFVEAAPLLLIFGPMGFLVSAAVSLVCTPRRLDALDESVFLGFPHWLRDGMALAFVVLMLWWSGPLIRAGGFGGAVIAIFVCLVGPIIACLLAARFSIPIGISIAT